MKVSFLILLLSLSLLLVCVRSTVQQENDIAMNQEQQQQGHQEQQEQQPQRFLRDAKNMSLEFFKTLFYTALSESVEPIDVQVQGWESSTEWGWNRSIFEEMNKSKPFPFILCDDATGTSQERKRQVASDAVGIDDPNDPTIDLNEYFVTITNKDNITCYFASINGTKAEQLNDFIVQPVTIFMKINGGTVSFTAETTNNDELQYAVWFAPGLFDRNWTAWSLNILDDILTVLEPLLELDFVVGAYQQNLTDLNRYLTETDPNLCDDLLRNSTRVESIITNDQTNSSDYVIVTFQQALLNESSNPLSVAGETCFVLWVLALAWAPEVGYIERRLPTNTFNVIEQWIGQSSIEEYRPFFDNDITGLDQFIAVSDTGLDLQNCYFRDDSIMNFGRGFDLSRRKVVQYVDFVNNKEEVNGHGTHVAGTIAGRKSEDGITNEDGFVDGMAPDAKLCFFDIGRDDGSGALSVPGARSLFNPGKDAGARVHSCSWGSSANFYTNQDRDFDRYIHDDESFLVVVAAGNSGPNANTVGSPAIAKNVLSVGASTSFGSSLARGRNPVNELASFSSVGPTQDGRIKPDIVAPGAHVLSAGSRDQPSCDPPNESDLPGAGGRAPTEFGVLSLQGTSMATPVVSGHCALVRQYFMEGWHGDGTKGSAESMELSGTLLKAVLINGARPLAGYGANEVDNRQGFGRLSLIDSLPLAGANNLTGAFLDREVINQGETTTYNFTLDANNQTCEDAQLSATLVWADLPGFLGCLDCVLNDLDLFVVQTTADGSNVTEHFPNGRTTKDSQNNVERIRLIANDGDSFVITVDAARLESGQQTYAIAIVFGCFSGRDVDVGTQSSARVTTWSTSSSWWLLFGMFMTTTAMMLVPTMALF